MKPMFLLRLSASAGVALLSCVAAHAWQFPERPTHPDQCRPVNWISTDEGQAYVEKRKQANIQLDYGRQCDSQYKMGSSPWHSCYQMGERRRQQVWREMDAYQSQANARYNQARDNCTQVARHNASELARAKEAEQRQREQAMESQRRQREQQAENERRQSQMQAEQNRINAQREAQAQYWQRQADQQRREAERRQTRVVGTYEPSGHGPATRPFQTPEMRQAAQAQAQADAAAQQRAEAIQTGKALRGLFDAITDAKKAGEDPSARGDVAQKNLDRVTDKGRREAYDKAFNPQGFRNPGVDASVTSAQQLNGDINRARGVPNVATRVANDAYAATGSQANNALGQFDQAMNSFNASTQGGGASSSNTGAGSRPSSTYNSSNAPMPRVNPPAAAPTPVITSMEGLEQAMITPEAACRSAAPGATRDRCVAEQCKQDQFRNHPLCRKTP